MAGRILIKGIVGNGRETDHRGHGSVFQALHPRSDTGGGTFLPAGGPKSVEGLVQPATPTITEHGTPQSGKIARGKRSANRYVNWPESGRSFADCFARPQPEVFGIIHDVKTAHLTDTYLG